MKRSLALLCAVILLLLPMNAGWAQEAANTVQYPVDFTDGQNNLYLWPLDSCRSWLAQKLSLPADADDSSIISAYSAKQDQFHFAWQPDVALQNFNTISTTELSTEQLPHFGIYNLNRDLDGKKVLFVATYNDPGSAAVETFTLEHILQWDKVTGNVSVTPATLTYVVRDTMVHIRAENIQAEVTLNFLRDGAQPSAYQWYRIEQGGEVPVAGGTGKSLSLSAAENAHYSCSIVFGENTTRFEKRYEIVILSAEMFDTMHNGVPFPVLPQPPDIPIVTSPSSQPQTGDHTPVALCLGLMAASAAGFALLHVRRKRSA